MPVTITLPIRLQREEETRRLRNRLIDVEMGITEQNESLRWALGDGRLTLARIIQVNLRLLIEDRFDILMKIQELQAVAMDTAQDE